jgi:hypothetical protein
MIPLAIDVGSDIGRVDGFQAHTSGVKVRAEKVPVIQVFL